MLLNMALSAGIGLVPVVGDVGIAVFKTNSRNAALLEEYLRIRGEEYLKLERERIQNQEEVKPGAGNVPGEKVPGGSSTTGVGKKSFWSRKSSKKAVGKTVADNPEEIGTPTKA